MRTLPWIGWLGAGALLRLIACSPAQADEGQTPTPFVVASDAVAEAAIDVFRREYRARGLKGDERLMQRDFAMRTLAETNHPKVVKELLLNINECDTFLDQL